LIYEQFTVGTYVEVNEAFISAGNNVQLYPNPAQNEVYLHIALADKQETDIMIFNYAGQLVHSEQAGSVSNTTLKLDIAQLPAGMYVAVVKAGDEYMKLRLSGNNNYFLYRKNTGRIFPILSDRYTLPPGCDMSNSMGCSCRISYSISACLQMPQGATGSFAGNNVVTAAASMGMPGYLLPAKNKAERSAQEPAGKEAFS
jgi:hypothetical protein